MICGPRLPAGKRFCVWDFWEKLVGFPRFSSIRTLVYKAVAYRRGRPRNDREAARRSIVTSAQGRSEIRGRGGDEGKDDEHVRDQVTAAGPCAGGFRLPPASHPSASVTVAKAGERAIVVRDGLSVG